MISGEKILVTGVHGAVAFPLARSLAAENEVWGVARFSNPEVRATVEAAGITTRAVDISSGVLDELPDDFTYVLHLAYFRGGNEDFDEAFRVNGEGTGLVLSHCRRAKAALVMSSHVMYTPTGDPSHHYRELEAVGGSISPASPTSSASKVAEEAVARFCSRALNLPVTIPRLNTVYGPDPRYLPSMHALSIAEGKPVVARSDHCPHTPIHIDDMVWQLEALLDAARVPARIVNWCGDSDVTVKEWCELASVASGRPLDLTVRTVPGAPCSNAADPAQRLALTGPCRGSFREGYLRSLGVLRPEVFSNAQP
jgi:nucleoside-diphosphate-sugar epimerase